jgi:hypothetical protein
MRKLSEMRLGKRVLGLAILNVPRAFGASDGQTGSNRITSCLPTIHPETSPDAGRGSRAKPGLAADRPLRGKGRISVDTALGCFIIVLIR